MTSLLLMSATRKGETEKQRRERFEEHYNTIPRDQPALMQRKQDIADGVWKTGDKIPSEGELAEIFGVNRLSVRMALQKLSALNAANAALCVRLLLLS